MRKTNKGVSVSSAKVTKVTAIFTPIQAPKTSVQKASVLHNSNVLYLTEGIKGKDLQRAKIDSNRMNKADLQSLSFCLNQFKKHGIDYLACFKGSKMEDLTPKNLIPCIGENDAKRQVKNGGKWSYFMLETTIGNYYKKGKK
jgi:hypothetical protein